MAFAYIHRGAPLFSDTAATCVRSRFPTGQLGGGNSTHCRNAEKTNPRLVCSKCCESSVMNVLMHGFILSFCNRYGAWKVGRMLVLLPERVPAPLHLTEEMKWHLREEFWRGHTRVMYAGGGVWTVGAEAAGRVWGPSLLNGRRFPPSSPRLNSGLDAYALSLSSFPRWVPGVIRPVGSHACCRCIKKIKPGMGKQREAPRI